MSLSVLFPPTVTRPRCRANARLLQEVMSRELGAKVVVRIAESYGELESGVKERSVDLAWAPPSICAQAALQAQTVLKVVRYGQSMYRSALVCRKSDDLSLGHLAGKRAAWVDPLSTGGHLLAVSCLRDHGLKPEGLFRSTTFHQSYQGALLALLHDEADVSSIYVHGTDDEAVRQSLREHVGASEAQLRGFAFTAESPADGLINTGTSQVASRFVDLLFCREGDEVRELLLDVLAGEELAFAEPTDYGAVRRGLQEVSQECLA